MPWLSFPSEDKLIDLLEGSFLVLASRGTFLEGTGVLGVLNDDGGRAYPDDLEGEGGLERDCKDLRLAELMLLLKV